MRILHCIRSLDPGGGGPADFVSMVAAFQARFGIEIEVLTQDSAEDHWIKNFPAKVNAIGSHPSTYGFNPKVDQWLKQNLNRFDIVVVNGLWCYISLAVSRTCRAVNQPYVVFTDGMLDPWFAARYPLKHIKKLIYWKLFEHSILSGAAGVFFTAEQERLLARQSFRPYKIKEFVIPYGTHEPPNLKGHEPSSFAAPAPYSYLLYLGRVHEKKGVDLLLKAYCSTATKTTLKLVIAGPVAPHYTNTFNGILAELPKDIRERIILIDMVSGLDKWSLLANADALVLPSHQENFGRVVSEALSCSVPVLLTNKVNIFSAVEKHQAGIATNDDLSSIEAMLSSWYLLSSEEKNATRTRARECYEANFDATRNFSQYLALLKTLTRKRDH